MKADFTATPNLTQFQQWLRNNASYSMIHTNLGFWKILLLHQSQTKILLLEDFEKSRKRQNKIVRTSWETKCEKVYQTRTSDWSSWSDCDITCNQNNEFVTGKRERTRYCIKVGQGNPYMIWNINRLIDWNIKGTSNFDGFKPLPCPTSNTFEYDYTCRGVCRNTTDKRERSSNAPE